MNYEELCKKHKVRVVADVSSVSGRTIYKIQRKVWGIWWVHECEFSKALAIENAKDYVIGLENRGKVIWP